MPLLDLPRSRNPLHQYPRRNESIYPSLLPSSLPNALVSPGSLVCNFHDRSLRIFVQPRHHVSMQSDTCRMGQISQCQMSLRQRYCIFQCSHQHPTRPSDPIHADLTAHRITDEPTEKAECYGNVWDRWNVRPLFFSQVQCKGKQVFRVNTDIWSLL